MHRNTDITMMMMRMMMM